ncbi:MAG: serine hydrolase, partial [Erythrobacteraceae bacterium]
MKPVSIWAGGLCLAVSVALAACGGEDGAPGPPVSVPSPSPSPSPTPTPTPTPTPSPGATLAYQSAADYALSSGARAVVIIHDGRMVLEQYANGGRADRGEALASGTKSFTCVLMAAAEDDGFLSVDDLASTLVPQWRVGGLAPQTDLKAQIRTRDLLSVSSGLLNSGVFGAALNTVDSYAQAFNAPSQFAPGTHAIYTPNSAQAVSAIFELATGGAFDSAGVIRGGRDGITYLQQRVF